MGTSVGTPSDRQPRGPMKTGHLPGTAAWAGRKLNSERASSSPSVVRVVRAPAPTTRIPASCQSRQTAFGRWQKKAVLCAAHSTPHRGDGDSHSDVTGQHFTTAAMSKFGTLVMVRDAL